MGDPNMTDEEKFTLNLQSGKSGKIKTSEKGGPALIEGNTKVGVAVGVMVCDV